MTRTLPLRSALVVVLAFLAAAPLALARTDDSARLQMIWPANGTVTSYFGEWRGGRRHEGLDIGVLSSLRVRAATAGVVQSVGYVPAYEGYGNVIVVDLPGPLTAIYAHLAAAHVRVGQPLRKGQPIGVAGCTGSCSGTHLHFEVRRNDSPINPLPFLG
jgi:murein DD-endopeptidase MepM/ murein hydrolase activator NlpD